VALGGNRGWEKGTGPRKEISQEVEDGNSAWACQEIRREGYGVSLKKRGFGLTGELKLLVGKEVLKVFSFSATFCREKPLTT